MKRKLCCVALVISATMVAPARGDGLYSNNVRAASRAPARSSSTSVRSMPRGNFGGGRPIVAGQRFSSMGMPTGRSAFRQSFVNPNRAASIAPRLAPRTVDRGEALARFGGSQNRFGTSLATERTDASRQLANINRGYVNPNSDASLAQRFASRTFNGSERLTRFSNSEARPARFENPNRNRFEQFTRRPLNRSEGLTRFSNSEARPARFENRNGDRFGQLGNRNRGLSAGREHIFARRSANWQPNWDRHRDHWWNGHRCRFANGSWVIFDLGFYPWWPYSYPYGYGYPYSYPYDYYPSHYSYDSSYGYDPGGYDPGGYDRGGYDPGAYNQNDADYYGRGAYNSRDQYTDRTVVAVQTELAKEGYYRGEIDGILGPETRRAIVSFQSDHGLHVTGNLSQETLSTLGL